MKLYDFEPAASAQRVRVFLAEKGLELPTEQLNVREGAQFTPALTEMNPFHCVPFLELDDGTVIAESLSICRYLEEVYPSPLFLAARAPSAPSSTCGCGGSNWMALFRCCMPRAISCLCSPVELCRAPGMVCRNCPPWSLVGAK
ncbi:glutathione S-transferase N-terminal domain-containing protein [Bradyrhizobium yuanmingense]|uniref:glutathione S-transferase N-terminal domain-containing protein n=1 Tax=Bradyrhizobium yuanmingense TaxID=108015 RepID=UPI003D2EE745